jgi:hypothetical protein
MGDSSQGRRWQRGKAFEARVADAYRALGFQITPNIQLPGKQTDILARREVPGVSAIVLAIECKDKRRPIGNEEVLRFIARINAQVGPTEITHGALVSASGFTADARAASAGHQNINLLSWEELSTEVIDVRHGLRELVNRYQSSAIHGNYLAPAIELISWGMGRKESRAGELEREIGDWVGFEDGAGIGVLLVLADFGLGKTTLLRRLEYERALAHLEGGDPRIPLFVPLREFWETEDLGILLRSSFREAFSQDLSMEALWDRINAGGFYVLLDGFDEMVDRSDAPKRAELFNLLMPVLRSPSPAALTSRPSYLVGREELELMLNSLSARLAPPLARPDPSAPQNLVRAMRLRRRLVEEHMEVRPELPSIRPLNPREVQVVELLELDRPRLEQFVTLRRNELEQAGSSVEELMDFIDRVYDLGDLASRPILLELIISTAIDERLDTSDTEAEFGPSGLYEIYTQAKLDLDIAKGPVREKGLSASLRRELAEGLAVHMYREGRLEVDFAKSLAALAGEVPGLHSAPGNSGLSREEIATDFATCSFVTLEEGHARFVHKTFRGFFLARAIKSKLPSLHPLLDDYLEREILYFLGGFAPTEPKVAEQLWNAFEETEADAHTRRRNLLVAYFYTASEHRDREIPEARISVAEFTRLSFTNCSFSEVTWAELSAAELAFTRTSMRANWFEQVGIGELVCEEVAIEASFDQCDLGTWRGVALSGEIGLKGSSVERLSLSRSKLVLRPEFTRINRIGLVDSTLACELGDADLGLAEAELDNSCLRLNHCGAPREVSARDSLIALRPKGPAGRWTLQRSLLFLDLEDRDEDRELFTLPRIDCDSDSVVLLSGKVRPEMFVTGAGVFGSIAAEDLHQLCAGRLPAWGLLTGDRYTSSLSGAAPGYRFGSLLLFHPDRFASDIEDELPSLAELWHLAREFDGVSPRDRLEPLIAKLKAEHHALVAQGWPAFEARQNV